MKHGFNKKQFQKWIELKEFIDEHGGVPHVSEGEIWWAAIGENVGVEICGKGEKFSRPVVILRRISRYGFMAIPLTSQKHDGSWYVQFEFQGKMEYAVLAQARILSTSRLYGRMGKLSKHDFTLIKDGFKQLFTPE